MSKLPTKQELQNAKIKKDATMTRRIVTPKQIKLLDLAIKNGELKDDLSDYNNEHWLFAQFKVGDIVWGREPAKVVDTIINPQIVGVYFEYLSDNKNEVINLPLRFISNNPREYKYPKWLEKKQGIPNGCIKEMARYFYRVASVRVERLQDITYEDICKEGYDCLYSDIYDTRWKKNKATFYGSINDNKFKTREEWMLQWWVTLWNSTAKKSVNDWDSNPYVWVIEYERLEYIK